MDDPKAAQAGKHVLCEKPLSKRAADVERMAAACEQAGVILMEAFMWRHHPQHARVKELLAAGEIGELTFVRASHAFAMDAERRGKPDVRVQPGLDGGSLMDIGCYPLNAARFLFDAEPIEVTALQRFDQALGVDTSLAMLLRFPGDRPGAAGRQLRRQRAAAVRDLRVPGLDRASSQPSSRAPGRPRSRSIAATSGGHRRGRAGLDQYGARSGSFRAERAGRPAAAPAEDGARRPGSSRRCTGAPRPARPFGLTPPSHDEPRDLRIGTARFTRTSLTVQTERVPGLARSTGQHRRRNHSYAAPSGPGGTGMRAEGRTMISTARIFGVLLALALLLGQPRVAVAGPGRAVLCPGTSPRFAKASPRSRPASATPWAIPSSASTPTAPAATSSSRPPPAWRSGASPPTPPPSPTATTSGR